MNTVQRWLCERSLHSDNSEARVRAIEKLSASGDPQAATLLLETLDDPDSMVRSAAASALGDVGDDRAVDNLSNVVLYEREMSLREEALAALTKIDPHRTTALLLRALDDPELSVRQAAAWALRKAAWHFLDDTQKARIAIVRSDWEEVARFGSAAVEPLEAAFRAGTQRTCCEVAEALGQIGTEEAVNALVVLLGDFDLGQGGREIVGRALRRFCADDLADAQQALICITLGEWSAVVTLGAVAVEPLVSALRYPSLCNEAARALIHIGAAGVDSLVALVKDRDQPSTVREGAAIALAEISDSRAVGPLLLMLTDPDMAVRQAAVWTLERLGWQPTEESQRALAAIAHDDWEQVRELGAAAVEPLLCLATDSMATEETVVTLEHILEFTPGDLSVNQLRTIAALQEGDRVEGGASSGVRAADEGEANLSYGRAVKLAKAELFRRGVLR